MAAYAHENLTAVTKIPTPYNEPVLTYAPGTPERAALTAKLTDLSARHHDLTATIGGVQRPGGGDPVDVVQPHRHKAVLGTLHNATQDDARAAVAAAREAARPGAPSPSTTGPRSSSRPPTSCPAPGAPP